MKGHFGTLPAMEKRPKLKKKCKYRYFEKALIARAWKTLQKVVSWTDFLAKNVYILITVFLTGNIVKGFLVYIYIYIFDLATGIRTWKN